MGCTWPFSTPTNTESHPQHVSLRLIPLCTLTATHTPRTIRNAFLHIHISCQHPQSPCAHPDTSMNLESLLHTPRHRDSHLPSSSMLCTALSPCSLTPCPRYFLSAGNSLLTHPTPCTLSIHINITHAPMPCLFTLCLNHIQSTLFTLDHVAHTRLTPHAHCLTPHTHLPCTQCTQALGLRTITSPIALHTYPTPCTHHTPCTLAPAMHTHLCTASSPCLGTRVLTIHACCAHSPLSHTTLNQITPHPMPSPTLGALSR